MSKDSSNDTLGTHASSVLVLGCERWVRTLPACWFWGANAGYARFGRAGLGRERWNLPRTLPACRLGVRTLGTQRFQRAGLGCERWVRTLPARRLGVRTLGTHASSVPAWVRTVEGRVPRRARLREGTLEACVPRRASLPEGTLEACVRLARSPELSEN